MNFGEPRRLPAEADEVLILTNPMAGAGPAHDRLDRFLAALTRWRLKGRVVADRSEIGQRPMNCSEPAASGPSFPPAATVPPQRL